MSGSFGATWTVSVLPSSKNDATTAPDEAEERDRVDATAAATSQRSAVPSGAEKDEYGVDSCTKRNCRSAEGRALAVGLAVFSPLEKDVGVAVKTVV